jgi:hypothetical protein
MRRPTTPRTTLRVVLLFAVVALQVLPEHLTSRLDEAVGWTRTGDWTMPAPVPRRARALRDGGEIDPADRQAQWHTGLAILLVAGNLGSAPISNGPPPDQSVKDGNHGPWLSGDAAARHFDIYKKVFQLHDGAGPSDRNDGNTDGGTRVGDSPAPLDS